MTDEDPPPLKSAGETPAELVRALRALGQGDRDSARLARVAERLGARVAADAAGGTPAGSWLRRLAGTKTGLTGLLLGVVVLSALGYALIADRRIYAPAPSPASPPAAEIPAAPTPAAVPATQGPDPAPPAQGGERPRVARSTERSRPAAPSAPAQRSAPAAVAPAPASPRASASATATSGVEAQVEPAPASTSPPQEQPQAQSKATDEAPAAARPSELTLLQRARKVAAKEPDAALRVLREHAERFPNGLLTPEREVLMIEVLRRLGRSAEAAQRLEQFKLRHPKSIYLRRLEH